MPHGFPHTQTAVADQTVVRMGDLMLDMPEDTTPQETSALSSFFMSMLEPAPGFNPIQDIIQSPTPFKEAARKAPFLPMALAMAIGGGSGKQKLAKVGARRTASKKTVSELIETIKENERVLVRGEAPALGGKMDYSTLGGNKVRSQYDLPHESGSSISVLSDYSEGVNVYPSVEGFNHHISVTKPQGSAAVDFTKSGNEISIGVLESWAPSSPVGIGSLEEAGMSLEEGIRFQRKMGSLKSSRRHNIQRQSAVNELLGAIAEYANKGDIIHPGELTTDSFTMLTKGLSKGPLKKQFKLMTAEDLKAMIEKGSLPEGWTARRARDMIDAAGGLGKISTTPDQAFDTFGRIGNFGRIGRKKGELAALETGMFQYQFPEGHYQPGQNIKSSLDGLLSKIEELNAVTKGVAKGSSRKLDVNVGENFEDNVEIAKTGIKELRDIYWKAAEDVYGKSGARKMSLKEQATIWDNLDLGDWSSFPSVSIPQSLRLKKWSYSQFNEPEYGGPLTAQARYMVRRLLDSQNIFDYKPFAIIKK